MRAVATVTWLPTVVLEGRSLILIATLRQHGSPTIIVAESDLRSMVDAMGVAAGKRDDVVLGTTVGSRRDARGLMHSR